MTRTLLFWRMGKRWWNTHMNTFVMKTEISSGPFLEGPREVLYLVGAQETAAGPSPLWPVRPHWMRSVAAARVCPVSPGAVSVRIQGVPLGWLLGCGRARDITCASSTGVLKPGLETQLCRSARVTSCLRVCICEMGTAVVPALWVGVQTGVRFLELFAQC